MGTDKRERQKQNREKRLAAERELAARQARQQRFRSIGLLLAVLLGVIGIVAFWQAQNDDDDDGSEIAVGDTADEAPEDDGAPDNGADPDGTGDEAEPIVDPITEAGLERVPPGEPVEPECPPAEGSEERVLDFTEPFEDCLTEGATYTATFNTSLGEIVVDLDTAETPMTTNNFVALARYGYYDQTSVFRADNSLGIVQGGSPHTQGNSDPGPGYNIEDEGDFDVEGNPITGPYTYEPGQLVMARSQGPNSASAQYFFTVTDAASSLDSQGTYVVFGEVTEGLDVLEEILALEVPLGGVDSTGGSSNGSFDASRQQSGMLSEVVVVDNVTITESADSDLSETESADTETTDAESDSDTSDSDTSDSDTSDSDTSDSDTSDSEN